MFWNLFDMWKVPHYIVRPLWNETVKNQYSAHKTKYFESNQYSYISVKLEYVETIVTMPHGQILVGAREKFPLQNFQTDSATNPASCSMGTQTISPRHKVDYSSSIQCSSYKPSGIAWDNPTTNLYFLSRMVRGSCIQ
jgi:hypothetical protein